MTAATAPALTLHVVAARDRYDTRRCAGRCRLPVKELDVIVADDRSVTHYDCLTQRALAALPAPAPDSERCWYGPCPLPLATARLCEAHNDILYGAPKKPSRRR